MKVRTTRAAGALLSTLLFAPLGAGIAVAGVDSEDAPEAPTSTASPAADSTSPTAPVAPAAVPVGIELNRLRVDALVSPLSQMWHSSGEYRVVLTVNDVIGIVDEADGSVSEYPGMREDVELSYNLNGAGVVAFTPAADGTFVIEGLTEGTNLIGLQATFQNTEGAMLLAAANLSISPTVHTEADTIGAAWLVTDEAGLYEDTLQQGQQITVTAPAGQYVPGEQVTLFVYDAEGAVVDTVVVTAGEDGSLTATYIVPADMVPGDYLLYFEGSESVMSYLLHVLEADEVPPGEGGPDEGGAGGGTTPDGTTPDGTVPPTVVDLVDSTPEVTSGQLTDTLATTGSEASTGIAAAGVATAAGVVLVAGAYLARRQRVRVRR